MDTETDEEKRLKEYRLKVAAMVENVQPSAFTNIFGGQKDLDADFDAFMDEEYNEDKIGGLDDEEIEVEEKIKAKDLDDAMDEFIEEKQARFTKLHTEFGQGTEEDKAKREIPHSNVLLFTEEDYAEVRAKRIQMSAQMDEEAAEKIYVVSEGEESDPDAKWDCETILTTYTNTDNHPGVIKTERRVRAGEKMKIELHKQFKVPVDGLIPMAEEIVVQKEKKAAKNNKQAYTRVVDESAPAQAAPGEGEMEKKV
jgi:hypothetical protein